MTFTKTFAQNLLIAAALLVPSAAFGQFSTPMRDIDSPARNAVAIRFTCTPISGGNQNSTCTTPFTIPAGHRLVITQVNIFVTVNVQTPPRVLLTTGIGATQGVHTFGATTYESLQHHGSTNTFIITEFLSASVTGPLGASIVDLSGYLIKL